MRNDNLYIIACTCPPCHYRPARKCHICAAGKAHTLWDDHEILASYLFENDWAFMLGGGRHPYIIAARDDATLSRAVWLSASDSTSHYEQQGAFIIPASCHDCWKAKRNQHIAVLPPYEYLAQPNFVHTVLKEENNE